VFIIASTSIPTLPFNGGQPPCLIYVPDQKGKCTV
jgi:hypothetical protein